MDSELYEYRVLSNVVFEDYSVVDLDNTELFHSNSKAECWKWLRENIKDETLFNAEYGKQVEEEEAEYRMLIIMRNGNSGEHYFDYFNDHPSAASLSDDSES